MFVSLKLEQKAFGIISVVKEQFAPQGVWSNSLTFHRSFSVVTVEVNVSNKIIYRHTISAHSKCYSATYFHIMFVQPSPFILTKVYAFSVKFHKIEISLFQIKVVTLTYDSILLRKKRIHNARNVQQIIARQKRFQTLFKYLVINLFQAIQIFIRAISAVFYYILQ